MNNQVELTDDELVVIQTGLFLMINALMNHEKEVEELDFQTKVIKRNAIILHDRFNKDYF